MDIAFPRQEPHGIDDRVRSCRFDTRLDSTPRAANGPPVRSAGPAAGMSLVEVLVGVTILAFVSLGIMAFLGTTIKQNQTSLDRSYATAIASERIQLITAMPYQSSANFANYKLPEETATAGTPATLTTPVGSIPDYSKFGRTVTLTYDSPVAGMLAVNVTVSWTNIHQNGATKTHTMITYLEPALEQGQ